VSKNLRTYGGEPGALTSIFFDLGSACGTSQPSMCVDGLATILDENTGWMFVQRRRGGIGRGERKSTLTAPGHEPVQLNCGELN